MLINLPTMNHFLFMVLTQSFHLLMSLTLGGSRIPNVKIPCELKRLCITNFTHFNCSGKIIIFFQICENVLCGINPSPHICMSMIYNNLSKVNLTNKSCQTFSGHCTSIWNQSHLASIFFFIWSITLFSLQICHACELFKIWTFMA